MILNVLEVLGLFFKGGVDLTFCVILSIILHNLNSAINYQIAKVSKLKILYMGSGESIELRGAKKERMNDIFVNCHGTTKIWLHLRN